MARQQDGGHGHDNPSDESCPARIGAIPLVLDDNSADDMDEDDEDFEEQIIRHRMKAARTLFHQPRSDRDTL